MLKQLAGLVLITLSGQVFAAIQVTTTTDENGENSQACSLREAISLINKDFPEGGYGGCTSTDKSATVELKAETTYELTHGSIQVIKTASLVTAGQDGETQQNGKTNATILAKTNRAIFVVQDFRADISNIQFSVTGVNLQGNAGANNCLDCENNGGLIFNTETLYLNRLKISNGVALQNGGAIYNEAQPINQKGGGYVYTKEVEFINNKAPRGAAIFTRFPYLTLAQSYFAGNEDNSADGLGATVYMDVDEQIPNTAQMGRGVMVYNSTFYNNKARALSVTSQFAGNNLTIVGNRGGVRFRGESVQASATAGDTLYYFSGILANSVLIGNAANNGVDCEFTAADLSYLTNIVYNTGCGPKAQANSQMIGTSGVYQVMADADNDGKCDKPPANGLFCPPETNPDHFVHYLRPRLLSTYTSLDESPIVNRPPLTGKTITACVSTDVREKDRGICDRGAMELVLDSKLQTNGMDIRYNQTATIDLSQSLGDGELMPAADCPAIFPSVTPLNGTWTNGCLRLINAPVKGTVSLLNDDALLYTPTRNFHGFDDAEYFLTTTTSRFADAANDKSVRIRTRIVMEPTSGITTRKVGSGAIELFGLFGLAALGWVRRSRQQGGAQ